MLVNLAAPSLGSLRDMSDSLSGLSETSWLSVRTAHTLCRLGSSRAG
jgi:hypothetical protein